MMDNMLFATVFSSFFCGRFIGGSAFCWETVQL